MTVYDLGNLPPLPPLPDELRNAVISIPFADICPYCSARRAGLLEGHCGQPDCRTARLDTDAAYGRADDQ